MRGGDERLGRGPRRPGPRGAPGRLAAGTARSQDGGRRGRAAKTLQPPASPPPVPGAPRRGGGGERSRSERARGRRKRPPCPPRPPSSSPEPTAGRPGPALGELKWRTAFSSSSSSPLLLSRAGAAGKMEDSGIVCVGCVCGRASPGRSGGRARGMGPGPEPRSGGALGRAQKMVGRPPGSSVGGGRGQGTRTLDSARHGPLPPAPRCPAAEFSLQPTPGAFPAQGSAERPEFVFSVPLPKAGTTLAALPRDCTGGLVGAGLLRPN